MNELIKNFEDYAAVFIFYSSVKPKQPKFQIHIITIMIFLIL